MKRIFIAIVLFAIIFQNCQSDKGMNISAEYYKYLEFYKENDTLFFVSSYNDVDTFLLTKVDSGFPERRVVILEEPHKFIRVKYHKLPVNRAKSRFEIQTDTSDITLIELAKYPNDLATEINFNFQNFKLSFENTLGLSKVDTTIYGVNIKNYYLLKCCENIVTDSNQITEVVWTNKLGLVAYKQSNGVSWSRKISK